MVLASEVLVDEVRALFEELQRLNGNTATYKRYKSETYDPDTDTTITYEEGTASIIKMSIESYRVEQDSRLQQDDKKVMLKQSDFPNSETGGNETPSAKDKIVIGSDTWTLDLNGEAVWQEDDTATLYTIFVRKTS